MSTEASLEGAPRSLREKQRQERQDLILQAAEQVYAEKGYRETSMDEIAARVGIATATIYSHFPSKEDLMVAAIFENKLQRVAQETKRIAAEPMRASDKLLKLFQFLINDDFFPRRVQLAYALGDSPQVQQALLTRKQTMSENAKLFSNSLMTIIEQGKAESELRADIATTTMLKAFISMVRAQSVPDKLLSDTEDTSAEELMNIYLHGIANRE
jgi:AcrR family transcriptional regulator